MNPPQNRPSRGPQGSLGPYTMPGQLPAPRPSSPSFSQPNYGIQPTPTFSFADEHPPAPRPRKRSRGPRPRAGHARRGRRRIPRGPEPRLAAGRAVRRARQGAGPLPSDNGARRLARSHADHEAAHEGAHDIDDVHRSLRSRPGSGDDASRHADGGWTGVRAAARAALRGRPDRARDAGHAASERRRGPSPRGEGPPRARARGPRTDAAPPVGRGGHRGGAARPVEQAVTPRPDSSILLDRWCFRVDLRNEPPPLTLAAVAALATLGAACRSERPAPPPPAAAPAPAAAAPGVDVDALTARVGVKPGGLSIRASGRTRRSCGARAS